MRTRTHFAHRIDMMDATSEIRRALELLASCWDGCTEAVCSRTASPSSRWSNWSRAGLATATPQRIRAGGKTMEVATLRITDAGRQVLGTSQEMTTNMTTTNLSNAADYFAQVVRPNKDAFFGSPSTFANALNLATALYHFHEWLFDGFRSKLEAEFGTTFPSHNDFWRVVQATDTRFGYIRDVTNASKHVSIGRRGKPSTGMTHIANTYIISSGYGAGGYGTGGYGGAPKVIFEDSGSQISFDDCANALFNYWDALLSRLQASAP
jgi:hypothetical protein